MSRRVCVLALSWLAVSSLAVAASSEETGPIRRWTFDRLDGATVSESTGAGHSAAVEGASCVKGVIDGAMAFNGRDNSVLLGDVGEFANATVAFWMKADNAAKDDDWQGLVTSDAWEEGVFHVDLRAGRIEAILHLGESRRVRLSSTRIKNGTWYHVALVADRERRMIRLLVNGQEHDAVGYPSTLAEIQLVRQVVGREFDGTRFARHFAGAIDDVRIYDHAVAVADIRQLCPDAKPLMVRDPRDIRTGFVIPDEGYCDQPCVVITKDGNWLCLLTTAGGHEGDNASHVVSTISTDHGRTWSVLVELEPVDGPPSVYSLPVVADNGRVYAFYDYNGDGFKCPGRSDCVGWFVYKYSDDHGRTWSKERYRLPMRVTAVDRTNTFDGKVQIFWGIGKPITFDGTMMFAFSKCGKYVIERSEGWFYRSDNILTETDPTKIEWQLLPDGDVGLKHPDYGEVQAEQNIVPMNDGSIYCMYRTAGDHPCHAYSRDGGHTWTMPEYATYTPGGRRFKNSRACPRVFKTSNGKYLFWFHHHGAHKVPYKGRNPAWLAGGIEKDGFIYWSQPEIVLFDLDPQNCLFDPATGMPGPGGGMSYPDLIEQDGRYWITETQKTVARVHPIDPTLLEGLWNQGMVNTVAEKGLVLDLGPEQLAPENLEQGARFAMPKLPNLAEGGGFTIEFWIKPKELSTRQVLLDSRDGSSRGVLVEMTDRGTVRIEATDGNSAGFWTCDRGVLTPDAWHHVAIVVDGAPDVISFVVDGTLCDGGDESTYGWGRFSPDLGDVNGATELHVVPSSSIQLKRLRIYDRYLRTSEAVGNFHAGT